MPDGDGVLIFTNGNHRKERFTCWWTIGNPGTVEYRFVNGWKWVGVLSSPTAVGPLLKGDVWLPGLTFEDAAGRARDSSQKEIELPAEDAAPVYSGVSQDSGDAGADMTQILAKENLFLILAQVSADDFASCLQISTREIQRFLRNQPAAAQQPEISRKISQFWRTAADGVLSGYRTDCKKARQVGLLDGNRRFLEVAVGAVAAEYALTRTEPADWGGDYLFPFPKSDRIEPDDLMDLPLSVTNYVWRNFPKNVLEQSVTANILPRRLKLPLDDSFETPGTPNGGTAWLRMVLVPSAPGLVRFPAQGTNSPADQPWQPDAAFYLAETETSFGQVAALCPLGGAPTRAKSGTCQMVCSHSRNQTTRRRGEPPLHGRHPG